MLNLRWSLLLGASISLFAVGCASDDSVSGGGTQTGTGGSSTAVGGNKATGGAASTTGGSKATGGASTGSGGGGNTPTGSAPQATVDAIKAFLAAGTHKAAPWKSEGAAPRDALPNSASPHGKVRVYFNDTLQASSAAGNGALVMNKVEKPHTTGSMVVKEMYDAQGAMIGVAANLKVDGDAAAWAYYGVGDKKLFNDQTGGAFSEAAPFFKTAPKDGAFSCTFCHFGYVFSPIQ
ncbi:MAG: hypothetical protein SFV15_14190 [Polyangiaceae bacterium]|nr:hypothetical protein [Polyangiaceae bacterium]